MSKKKQKRQAVKNPVTAPAPKITVVPASGLRSMTTWMMLLIAIVPFLLSRETFDSNLVPRYLYFSSIILIFIAVFYFFMKPEVRVDSIPSRIVLILAGAYTLWSIISTANAINPAEGIYEISRFLLNIIFLFLVTVMVMREESQLIRICKLLVIVALIQGLIGILQFYELAFTELPGNFKPYGLMANRNLFGSAQAFLIPFALFVLYKSGTAWKVITAFSLLIITWSLIISQTRSAWLASLAIIVGSLILISIFTPARRKKWAIGTAVGAACVAVLTTLILAADQEGTLSSSVTQRAMTLTGNTSVDSSATGNIAERFRIWEKTIAVIKDKPITGTGTSNWKIAVPAYGSEGMSWAAGYYVPDRPHNVYLHIAAETGIPGLIFYAGLWLIIAWMAIKVLLNRETPEERKILVILMLCGLGAFAIDSFFSFPTERIEHSLYTLLMGGIIIGSYQNNLLQIGKPHSFTLKRPILIGMMVIVLLNLLIGINKYKFEIHGMKAKGYEKAGNFTAVIDEVRAAKNPFVTLDPNGNPLQNLSGVAYKTLQQYDLALREFNIAKKYNPNNSRVFNNIGATYTDMTDYNNAMVAYQEAIKLTPDFELTLKNMALTYYQLGNDSACIATLKKVNVNGDEMALSLLQAAEYRLRRSGKN